MIFSVFTPKYIVNDFSDDILDNIMYTLDPDDFCVLLYYIFMCTNVLI